MLDPSQILKAQAQGAIFVGRVWRPEFDGPSVVAVRSSDVVDITSTFPTVRDLCEAASPARAASQAQGEKFTTLDDLFANTPEHARMKALPWLLAPVDLQVIKAAGVTFAVSLLERVIEEQARGQPAKAAAIRAEVENAIGGGISGLKPGSDAASALKTLLQQKGLWSQYLEVGIGPDAEIFTKAPPMAAVGTGCAVGILENSRWNNPEPEVVLVVNSRAEIVGATLGNDVNLRDVEGRSALLLGKAKDNNASTAIGPFVRLLDDRFDLDQVRKIEVDLKVEGADGFVLEGTSHMAQISRDPADLVAQMMGTHHQYPDGAVLFLGTMFAPTKDRDGPGLGFTHHMGDVVTISAAALGSLVNVVTTSDRAPPWTFGTGALMRNLAKRNLI